MQVMSVTRDTAALGQVVQKDDRFTQNVNAVSLTGQLDQIAILHGHSIGQCFVASGDPTDFVHETRFADLVASTRQRANALASLGIGPGDVVSLIIPLSKDAYPTLLATMAAATAAPLNYFLKPETLVRLIRASGSRTLLTATKATDDPGLLEKIVAIRAAMPELQIICFDSGPRPAGSIDLEILASTQTGEVWTGTTDTSQPARVLGLFHTGGTTGHPKLVPHTQAMYMAMLNSCGQAQGTLAGETLLAGLPLFHTSGALQGGLVPLLNGCRVVIPSAQGFRDPAAIKNYWRFIAKFGIGIGGSVPTILAALCAIKPDEALPSLKRMLCGSAPLSKTTIATIKEFTGGVELLEGWGMTETCGFSVMNPLGRTKIGSVGLPFPGVEAQVRVLSGGALGGECAAGMIGELVVRGDIVIRAYAQDRPDAFTSDGWLRTGDLARIDGDGFICITGRAKDIIIRGGHNIDPAMIEEPAYTHPAVQLAAAVGMPDKYAGELPVLYVQLKPNEAVTETDLLDFISNRIQERAATPKRLVILNDIPLTGPGKIAKATLRHEAIRATFQAEIDRAAAGVTPIQVSVVEDDSLGTVALLHQPQHDPAVRAAVETALQGYTVAFRWADRSSGDTQ
jgi:fatty-acyl-CoA synthase